MYTFIIVDDEALIRRGMLKKIRAAFPEEQLQFAGEADNGEAGLQLIRTANPDIIITDMRMPEMDGKSFLKLLQHDYPDKKVIVVSGYSDFEYMKEAISAKVVGYLLKPFSREEIRDTLKKAFQLLEAERSAQQRMEYSEIEKEEISYGADLQSLSNLILGIQPKDKAPAFRSNKMQALSRAERYVLMTAYAQDKPETETLPFASDNGVFIPHAQNERLGLYLLYEPAGGSDVQKQAEALAEQIVCEAGGETTVIVGISGVKTSLSQLAEAYAETASALNGRRVADDRCGVAVFTGDERPAEPVAWDSMDELLFFLEAGNAPKAAEWTGKLFEHVASTPGVTLGQVKATCRLLIHEVRDMLHRYFRTAGSHSASSSFEAVLAASFDIEAIQTYLLQVLPGIAEMLNERSIYSSDNVIDNIKVYIEQHYNKELTLEKLSSLFFINPSYCSYLFKEKTGTKLIDYVNSVRIGKAKEMLRRTDYKVYQIAKTLGYDNTKYFFRVFKKVTGSTPEEYRLSAQE